MAPGKTKYRVLVASSGEKIHDYFSSLLPPDEYELVDRNGKVVIDHLSEAQVIALAEIL